MLTTVSSKLPAVYGKNDARYSGILIMTLVVPRNTSNAVKTDPPSRTNKTFTMVKPSNCHFRAVKAPFERPMDNFSYHRA
jgi:hypothetical protein